MNGWIDGLVGLATLYFLWEQNQIFRRQNEIFAAQGKRTNALPEGSARRFKRYWPMLAMTILMLSTWAAVGFDYYGGQHSDEIPEFDASGSQNRFYTNYGHTQADCLVTARGNVFLAYRSRYRIAAACLVTDGSEDILDVPDLSVGSPHDVISGEILMTAAARPEISKRINNGINYFVLLIPPEIQTSQFSTLRQARALGVKIKFVGSERAQ